MKIGYLGPEGSYSQLAAERFGGQPVPYPTFYALVNALQADGVDAVVLPIENSLNGGVTQNIDLLQDSRGLLAVEEVRVKIDHRLVTFKGANPGAVTDIYSHAQALGQCARYLSAHFPQATLHETSSTSGCLAMLKTESDAGIVGAHCAVSGFDVSEECISDEATNYTQFLRVVKRDNCGLLHSNKIYFSVTCRHEPGALMRLLSVFAQYGLNMTKIGSRPIKDRVGEYRFFIELEADYASGNVQTALKKLQECTSSYKLLGCY